MRTLDPNLTITVAGSTVAVTGEVDASNADHLRLAILDAAEHHPELEVDLGGVTFMDSTGLRAISDASLALSPSGPGLVLCRPPRQVLRLLQITELGPFEIRQ